MRYILIQFFTHFSNLLISLSSFMYSTCMIELFSLVLSSFWSGNETSAFVLLSAAAAASASSPTLARALAAVQQTQKRPRSEKKPIPTDQKDTKYFERRKRNNLAAKKSRDARKAREDEIAIRASFLEKENAILRAQVGTLREEANSLKQLLLQKRSRPWLVLQIHHVKPVLYICFIFTRFLILVCVYYCNKFELLLYQYMKNC